MIEHLSHSSISTYLTCPRRWRFAYLDGLRPLPSGDQALGTAVHTALEMALAEQHAGKTVDRLALWSQAWERKPAEIEWGNELPEVYENTGFRLLGSEAVKTVFSYLRPQVVDGALMIEKRIELHVPGVDAPIIGFIDVIAEDGTVIDFKTAGRAWSVAQAQAETQPLVYLAALNQEGHPHTPGRFKHIVLTKTKTVQVQEIETERTLGELLWFMSVIADVWQGIKRGQFPKNAKSCYVYGRPCPFLKPCQEGK